MDTGLSGNWILPTRGEDGKLPSSGGDSVAVLLRPTLGLDSAADTHLNTRLPTAHTNEAPAWISLPEDTLRADGAGKFKTFERQAWHPPAEADPNVKSGSSLVDDFIRRNPGLDVSAIATLKAAPLKVQVEVSNTDLEHAKNPSAVLVSRIARVRDALQWSQQSQTVTAPPQVVQPMFVARRASPAGAPVKLQLEPPNHSGFSLEREIEDFLSWYSIDEQASKAMRHLPPKLQREVLKLQYFEEEISSKQLWIHIKDKAEREGLTHGPDGWIAHEPKDWEGSALRGPRPPAGPPPAALLSKHCTTTGTRTIPRVVPPPDNAMLRTRLWKGLRRKRLESTVAPNGHARSITEFKFADDGEAASKRTKVFVHNGHGAFPAAQDGLRVFELKRVQGGLLPSGKDGQQAPVPERISIGLTSRPMIVGRAKACDIMLQAQHVSKQHAQFLVQDSVDAGIMLTLKDMSSNGTWLNGQRLEQMRSVQVRIGDIIAFLPPTEAGASTPQLAYKVFPAAAGGMLHGRTNNASLGSHGLPGASTATVDDEMRHTSKRGLMATSLQGQVPPSQVHPSSCNLEQQFHSELAENSMRFSIGQQHSQGMGKTQQPDALTAASRLPLELELMKPDITWWLEKLNLGSYSSHLSSKFGTLWDFRDRYMGKMDAFFEEVGVTDPEHQRLFRHGFEWLGTVQQHHLPAARAAKSGYTKP